MIAGIGLVWKITGLFFLAAAIVTIFGRPALKSAAIDYDAVRHPIVAKLVYGYEVAEPGEHLIVIAEISGDNDHGLLTQIRATVDEQIDSLGTANIRVESGLDADIVSSTEKIRDELSRSNADILIVGSTINERTEVRIFRSDRARLASHNDSITLERSRVLTTISPDDVATTRSHFQYPNAESEVRIAREWARYETFMASTLRKELSSVILMSLAFASDEPYAGWRSAALRRSIDIADVLRRAEALSDSSSLTTAAVYASSMETAPDEILRYAGIAIDADAEMSLPYAISALAYSSKDDNTRALANIDKAIAIDEHYTYYEIRGDINIAEKDYPEAIKDFTNALYLEPERVWLEAKLIEAEVAQKFTKEAEARCKAIGVDSSSNVTQSSEHDVLLNCANVQLRAARNINHSIEIRREAASQAVIRIEKALALPDPSIWALLIGVEAHLLVVEADGPDTFVHLNRALELVKLAIASERYPARSLRWRGEVLAAQYRRTENQTALTQALADYDEAITLDPLNAASYYGRALVHLLDDDPELALGDLKKAVDISPTGPYYRQRGEVYAKLDRCTEAVEDLDRAIDSIPWQRELHALRGDTNARLSDSKAAIEDYRLALELFKSSGELLELDFYYETKDKLDQLEYGTTNLPELSEPCY